MFGFNNNNTQNNNLNDNSSAGNPPPSNSNLNQQQQIPSSQSSSNMSMGGYTSPYLSTEDSLNNISPTAVNNQNTFNSQISQSTQTPNMNFDNSSNINSNSALSFEDNLLSQPLHNQDLSEVSAINSTTLPADNTTPAPNANINSDNIFNNQQFLNLNPESDLNISNINEQNDAIPTINSLNNINSIEPRVSPLQILEQQATTQVLDTQNFDPENDLQIQDNSSKETHDIKYYLDKVIETNASDLHLTVGYSAMIRVDGKLVNIGKVLSTDDVKELLNQTLSGNQKELLEVNKEVDLSYAHGDKARFRVNAYNERGNLAAAYRLIPSKIKSISDLNLPKTLYDFTNLSQGLFLVTGPTGSGKSTTLAALLQEINKTQPKHIITIEDPIEYVYEKAKALVDQRELGQDTHDWSIALRSILRQDPDVVLIGEMRDFETIQAAITTAETGHLVFATLHTNSAAQSIDRIIDVFPPHQQEQIRTQLAGSLKGILSQRLIPKQNGGREAATELMIVTPAIQNLIREGKTYQIDNIISTSLDIGMTTLERNLVRMVREGKITLETAQEYAIRPEEVLKLMKNTSN